MPILPLLADPDRYRPCIQDLLHEGADARDYWLSLFERHAETLAALPVNGSRLSDQSQWPAFLDDYLGGLAGLREHPDRRGQLTVLELTRYRDERLAAHQLGDPFFDLKRRDNAAAIRRYPGVIERLASLDPLSRELALARGLFAGNLFDMGSRAAVDAFEAGEGDFQSALARVPERPWPIDDLDRWLSRKAYRACLFFVDNAGPDLILGVIPFVRYLASAGTRVTLAANSAPALNDVTVFELVDILAKLRSIDPLLFRLQNEGLIRVTASGCTAPLIDLRQLTGDCCEAASEADLLVLEGMGRAIESNYDARFVVDTLKIALIKDPMVARLIGTGMFDPVFRYECADEADNLVTRQYAMMSPGAGRSETMIAPPSPSSLRHGPVRASQT